MAAATGNDRRPTGDSRKDGTCSWYDVDERGRCYADTRSIERISCDLTPSTPAIPNCCSSKGSAPYWSNPPFLIFDIRALWRSGLSARAPECQKLKMVG